MKIELLIVLLVNLLSVSYVSCDNDNETRKLTVNLNPNCTDQLKNKTECDNFSLLYIEAESNFNKIHYIWNFRGGKPSALVAKTSKNSSLNINWNNFNGKSEALNFSTEPEYVYSSVINSFFLFNDTMDKGDIGDSSVVDIVRFSSENLNWTLKDPPKQMINKVTAEIYATTRDNGSFCIMFTAYGVVKHSDDLPHLYHSADSMQVDIKVNKIHSNFTNPRIAIELLTISSENLNEGTSKIHRIRNLDDEFTPGIFDVYHVLSPRSANDSKGAFLEFRPVCYNSINRTVSSSTELTYSNPESFGVKTDEFENSLPYMYFPMDTMSQNLKESMNITFGMSNDGFFSRTNYISFSYLIGIGSPLSERISLFVIIFASIGLGVPLLLLIFGGTYVAIKRYRN